MSASVKQYAQIHQYRIQSPQALSPAVGREERLWGTEFYHLRISAKKKTVTERQSKKIFFSNSSGDQPLTKEPEDSGYEIANSMSWYTHVACKLYHFSRL